MKAIDYTRLGAAIWAVYAFALAMTLTVVEPRAWPVAVAVGIGAAAFLLFTYLAHRDGEGR